MSAPVSSTTTTNWGRQLVLRAKEQVRGNDKLKGIYYSLKAEVNSYISNPSQLASWFYQVGFLNQYQLTRDEKLAIYTWLCANLAHHRINSTFSYEEFSGKFTGIWVYHPSKQLLQTPVTYEDAEMSEGYFAPDNTNESIEKLTEQVNAIIAEVSEVLHTQYSARIDCNQKREVKIFLPMIKERVEKEGLRVHYTKNHYLVVTKF